MKQDKPINIYACHLHDGKREAIAVKDVISVGDPSPTQKFFGDYRLSMDVFIRPEGRREFKKYLQPFRRLQELYTYAYGLETLHETLYESEWHKYAYRHMSRDTHTRICKSYTE